jgi:hypothetical protein
MLPTHIQAALDRLAAEQHVTIDDLGVAVVTRMMTDLKYLAHIETALRKIVPLRSADIHDLRVWPKDPLDFLACALYLTLFLETQVDEQVLTMDELARWDAEVKATGRSLEELMGTKVFERMAVAQRKRNDAALAG